MGAQVPVYVWSTSMVHRQCGGLVDITEYSNPVGRGEARVSALRLFGTVQQC
jgi:hypothetical protein